MESKGIITVAVTVTVAVIVLAGILMPVLDDATTTEDKFTNDGVLYARTLDADSECIISFDHTTPTIVTIDDVDIDMIELTTALNTQQITIAFSDDWFIRCLYNAGNKAIVVYKCGTSSAQAIGGASESNGNDMTVTISSGAATITYGETTLNYNIDADGMVLSSKKADYIIKSSTDEVYVNSDSIVYGAGRTDNALGTSNSSFNAISKASIDDGVTLLYYSPQYTISADESVTYTTDSGHKDLYLLKNYVFNLTDNGGVDHPITYGQIFVPAEVTAERSVHFTDSMNGLLAVIPMLILVAVLIGVAAVVLRNRMG